MKQKFFILTILFILAPLFVFSQTWRSTIDLNIDVNSNYDRSDLFTNRDGSHVITHEGNQIKYYLFSYNGTQIRSATIVSGINESEILAKINGNDDKVYVVYKQNSTIYTKRSTDAGQNWTNMQTIPMNQNSSNGMDTWADADHLHLSWAESDSYTYHNMLEYDETNWGTKKEITDASGDFGGAPTVTSSSNKIHVSYANYNCDSKLREKHGTVWQTYESMENNTWRNMVAANDSKLHYFYYDIPYTTWSLYHKTRDLSSGSWSSSTLLLSGTTNPAIFVPDRTVSNNNQVHVVYTNTSCLYYRDWNSSWNSAVTLSSNTSWSHSISKNGNDIYALWNDEDDETIYIKQRDYAPLTPANFAGSWSGNHPRISWTKSRAADFKEYIIEKRAINANWAEYETITNKNTTSFVDNTENKFTGGGFVKGYVYYRMKQKDMTNNISPLTDSERFAVNGLQNIDNAGNDAPDLKVDDFALMGNFPNPFNPLTKIAFNLPSAEYVTLEVYDVNGKKVNTLVSEYKEAGSYSVEFSGQNLSSGIYIYKMTAGKFSAIKRMLLVK